MQRFVADASLYTVDAAHLASIWQEQEHGCAANQKSEFFVLPASPFF